MLGAFLDLSRLVRAAKRGLRSHRQIAPQHHRARHHDAGDPAGVFARGLGGLVITSAFMLALMVLTSPSVKQRSRIIVMTVVAAIIVVVLIGVLLSFNSIGEMFKQRASLDQSYDSGRLGRFGRHILGAEMALPAVRNRPPAVQPLLPRGHPQFLSERIDVRRLDRRRLLSRAGVRHGRHGIPATPLSGYPGSAPTWRSSRLSSAPSA